MPSLSATTDGEHRPHPRIRLWTNSILVFFSLMGFGFGSWLSRLPAMRDHIDASTFQMSVYGFCLAAGSVAGLLLAGKVVGRIGPRRAILWSGVLAAIAMPIAALLLWEGFELAGIIGLITFGFLFSTADVAMNVSGAGAERALGRTRMPMFHAGFSMGNVLAMGIGATAEALNIAVPLHLTFAFAVILVGTIWSSRAIPHDPFGLDLLAQLHEAAPTPPPGTAHASNTTGTDTAAAPQRRPWWNARILMIGLIMLTMSLAEGSGADWIPLALVDGRDINNTSATLILGAFFIFMTVVRLFGAPILDRFGRVAVLRGGGLLAIVGILSVIFIPHPIASLLGAIAWGIGVAFGFPVGMSAAADNPETAVRDVATVSTIAYTAFLMGPMLIGFLGEHLGLLTAFWPLVAAAALAVIFAPAAREPEYLRPRASN